MLAGEGGVGNAEEGAVPLGLFSEVPVAKDLGISWDRSLSGSDDAEEQSCVERDGQNVVQENSWYRLDAAGRSLRITEIVRETEQSPERMRQCIRRLLS